MGLGRKIQELRLEKDYGLREFAKKAKIGASTLQRMEENDAWPRLDNAIKIAGAFGMTLEELVYGDISEIGRVSPEDEIRDAIERLPGITPQDADDIMELLVVSLDQKRGRKDLGKRQQGLGGKS